MATTTPATNLSAITNLSRSARRSKINKRGSEAKLKPGATGSDTGGKGGPPTPAPTRQRGGGGTHSASELAAQPGNAHAPPTAPKPPPGYRDFGSAANAIGDKIWPNSPGAQYRRAMASYERGGSGATVQSVIDKMTTVPTMTETVGPAVDQLADTRDTEAEQAARLANEQGALASNISAGIQTDQGRLGRETGRLQREARRAKGGLDTDIDKAMARTVATPDKVKAQFDAKLGQLEGKITDAQGVIDQKQTAAMAEAYSGKAAAMQSAVQGIQGNINSAIAQINADPNLTPAQKTQMISQTRMQGAGQMAPAVGATIFQFTQLATNTMTAFGQMSANLQTTGVSTFGQMATAGADAYANSMNAANSVGANILATQANADGNYLSAQANLSSMRATLELQGDGLRASLIPAQGTHYAQYGDGDLENIQLAAGMRDKDNAQLAGTAGLLITQEIGKQANAVAGTGTLIQGAQFLMGAFT